MLFLLLYLYNEKIIKLVTMAGSKKHRLFSIETPSSWYDYYMDMEEIENRTPSDWELTIRVLRDAIDYRHFTSFQISEKLWDYLVQKYHITTSDRDEIEYTAIVDNLEVSFIALTGNNHKMIGIFTTPSELGELETEANLLAREWQAPKQGAKIGLSKMLDPNWGGRNTMEYINAVAGLIY